MIKELEVIRGVYSHAWLPCVRNRRAVVRLCTALVVSDDVAVTVDGHGRYTRLVVAEGNEAQVLTCHVS